MTEQLHFHFSLSCIGEGNGNPLQCSCLENPRDGGAWWMPSMGSHRVGHDWNDLTAAAAYLKNLFGDLFIYHIFLPNGNPKHWSKSHGQNSQQFRHGLYHVLTVGRALGMNNYLLEFKDFKIPARTQTSIGHWLPLPDAASEMTAANLWLEEI